MLSQLAQFVTMSRSLGGAARINRAYKQEKKSLGMAVEHNARHYPDGRMIVFEGTSISWGECNRLSNQIVNHLTYLNVRKGDVVSILMGNSLDTIAAIIAVSKLGAIASMVNSKLSGESIVNCISRTESAYLLFSEEGVASVGPVHSALRNIGVRGYGYFPGPRRLACPEWAIPFMPSDYADGNPSEIDELSMDDVGYYYFSAETTANPVVSKVTHRTYFRLSRYVASVLFDMQRDDLIYICHPLYREHVMFSGVGAVVFSGASMLLRRDFSAEAFLPEVRTYGVSGFTYTGDMCERLMAQPRADDDGETPITKCVGSGLRTETWMAFKQRYGIKKIGEYHGNDKGYGWCFNALNKDKTVGFCTKNHVIVKYDAVEHSIVTGYGGWCRKAKKNQPGLLLVEVKDDAFFDTYTEDERANSVVHNVLKRGDCYLNTGDLLRRVDVGFSFLLNHYEFVGRAKDIA